MKKVISRVRAPKGFYFQIVEQDKERTRINLWKFNDQFPIGYVVLVRSSGGRYYQTHSSLNVDYHGKGLGTLLYARAIQFALTKGWKVQSSGYSSFLAQRVWRGNSIRKYFSIRCKKNRDPRYDKWYAYAKNK